jgi:DNA-binding transcriptional ArsR family regulator
LSPEILSMLLLSLPAPTGRDLQMLHILWLRKQATFAEATADFHAIYRTPLEATAVGMALRRLEEKGYTEGQNLPASPKPGRNPRLYRPVVTRRECLTALVSELIRATLPHRETVGLLRSLLDEFQPEGS